MPREFNELGSIIIKETYYCRERYIYDFKLCSPDKGWEQYDTKEDDWYFGIWITPKRM